MSRRVASTPIATLLAVRVLPVLASLAWLAAFVATAVPAPAEDVKWLSESLLENEADAALTLASEHDSAEFPEPPAVEPSETTEIGYDRGLFLRYSNARSQSFELKMNARFQWRYVAFSRDDQSWTDQAGVTHEIRNRDYFDNERTRLVFSGHAFAPEIKYFVQLDGDTDDGHTVEFFDYWWGYELSEVWEIQFGKRKVPAVRNWLLPAFDTRLVDRPMAADFFRPDRSEGLWLVGQPTARLHCELMVGDSYRSVNLSPANLNDRFAFAGTAYWDPWAPYGNGVVDFEQTSGPAVRVGHSWVYASHSGLNDSGRPLGESDFVRLSDGTRLTQTGALAPGATVERYDVLLNAADLAVKYRGWSLNAEYFWQWIGRIRADREVPCANLFQHGGYVEAGFFVIPQRLELNAHYSRVSGKFATRNEYTGGFRWYFRQGKNLHLSFDVTALDGSPLQNTASDILAGDDGVLFRTQFQGTF